MNFSSQKPRELCIYERFEKSGLKRLTALAQHWNDLLRRFERISHKKFVNGMSKISGLPEV